MIANPWIVGALALAIPTLLVLGAVVSGGTYRDATPYVPDELEGPN